MADQPAGILLCYVGSLLYRLFAIVRIMTHPSTIMPALFIGHGSPMNAIEDNDWTRAMSALGKRLPRPELILCISAHWLTEGSFVTAAAKPRMIYDMSGFPPELYRVDYPAPGSPFWAKHLCERFTGIKTDGPDDERRWGLDHGSWSVLKFLFPAADVPVLQLSIDFSRPGAWHLRFGRELAALRHEGVMILGSGNIVHNLRAVSYDVNEKPFGWALEFDQWFKAGLDKGHTDHLATDYNATAAGRQSVPTPDHYFPALYVAGAAQAGEPVNWLYDAIQHGSLSMRAFGFGLAA